MRGQRLKVLEKNRRETGKRKTGTVMREADCFRFRKKRRIRGGIKESCCGRRGMEEHYRYRTYLLIEKRKKKQRHTYTEQQQQQPPPPAIPMEIVYTFV